MEQSIRFETASLTIREFTFDDYDALYALTRQSEITDILPDWDMSEEQLQQFLQFVISSYPKFGPEDVRILLAIEHKQDRQLIGWCGVFPNDMLDSSQRELAYAISKDYRNQGLTTEAAQAVASYVFRHSHLQEIVAIVKPLNHASRRVIEKAQFTHRHLVQLSDGAEYDYFVLHRHLYMVRPVSFEEIEPYMDILAEVEHVHLDRQNPEHEQWLRHRIQLFYARGAQYFAYHDPCMPRSTGIISVLHEVAPAGIDSLGLKAEVLQVGVSAEGRRQGIGSILLRHVEEVMRRRGVYCLFMMTYAEDYDVISFYGKNGFIPVATLPDVYGPSLEGNVFMRKILR